MSQRSTRGRRALLVDCATSYIVTHRLPLCDALAEKGFEVHILAPEDRGVDTIEERGIVYHRLELDRHSTSPLTEAGVLAKLVRAMRGISPDLVYLRTPKLMLYGGIAARTVRVPAVISHVAGLGYVFESTELRARVLRRALTPLFRLAFGHPNQTIVFQNPDDHAMLTASGIAPASRSVVIRSSGVDIDDFVPAPPASGDPVVVLAGRLFYGKGVGEFAEAARTLKKRGVPARFALVGDVDEGNVRSVGRQQIAEWEQEGIVEYWGRRDDMKEVYRQASVVCLPSHGGEGVPKVLLEGAATRRALVATDVPGCREICLDGRTGRLVPPRDAARLADALGDVLGDRTSREHLAEEARRIVADEFSSELVVSRLMDVVTELGA